MSLDRRGVNQQFCRRPASRRQSMENIHPDALARPADEAIVECLLGTIGSRGIYPPAAGLQHADDAADDPTIVNQRFATCILGKMRLKSRGLPFAQPKIIPSHSTSPFLDAESRDAKIGNPFMGPEPS